ncbi:MAG TPA: CHAD domain-containing protein [Verrucomicrobiae bacterium]
MAVPAPSRQKLQKHLQHSLQVAWGLYCRRFKQCRRKFSESSVHQLRVATRRLLALLEVLSEITGEDAVEPPRRLLKKWLRRFARLRDTQVQLPLIDESLRIFPEARTVRSALLRRERKLTRRLAERVRGARPRGLEAAMAGFRSELRRCLRRESWTEEHWSALVRAIELAFAEVNHWRGRSGHGQPLALHRMRIAFKKFRYGVEALQPVLHRVPRRQLAAMNEFQTRLGDIQDSHVMLGTLAEFCRKNPKAAVALRALRRDVKQRRDTQVRAFIATAGQMNEFWPPR